MNAPRARAHPQPDGRFVPQWSSDGMIWRPVITGHIGMETTAGRQSIFSAHPATESQALALEAAEAFVRAISPL